MELGPTAFLTYSPTPAAAPAPKPVDMKNAQLETAALRVVMGGQPVSLPSGNTGVSTTWQQASIASFGHGKRGVKGAIIGRMKQRIAAPSRRDEALENVARTLAALANKKAQLG